MKTNNNKGVCDTPQTDTPPQGYKNSPLGIIPEDWEVKRLGEICEIDSRSLSSQTNPDYEFNYISLSDVNNETFEIVTTKQKFSTAPSRARRIVKKGDVIISTVRPNLQGFMQIKNNVENLIVSTGFSVLSPQKCNSDFLYLYVFSQAVTKQFYQLVVGSNYPAVNSSDVVNLKIPLPPLPEQQKIAAILSIWDEAIEKQTAIIEKLTLRKKGLMQQVFNEQWIMDNGKLQEVKLRDVAKVIMGQSPDSNYYNENKEGLPLIQGNADINNRKTIQRIWTTQFPKVCNADDIIMTVRAPVGFIGMASEYSCLGRGVCALQPYNIDKSYFYQLMLYNESKWKSIEQGGIFSAVGSEDIIHYPLSIIHSLEKQTDIAAVLTTADSEINLAKQKLDSLRQQKKGLMQVLLTGEKRVKINN
ncbi:MAG: restriction endonuclease subunit S [Bacteroidales bacterium]|nr:restriction endonuclease subunit S [Bacteroidales bacterium]